MSRQHYMTALLLLTLGIAAAGTIAGCQPKREFTPERFETLYIGMPEHAVEQKLGAPAERTESVWVYIREMPYERGEVYFQEGKVAELKYSVERPRPASQPAGE